MTNLMLSKNIQSYPLGDELILFDELTKQLYRINSTATLIWEGCHAGLSLKEIISVLLDTTGLKVEQIAEDVKSITSHWQKMGFFQDSRKTPFREQKSVIVDQPLVAVDNDGPLSRVPSIDHKYKFRILDTCFQLSLPTKNELHLVTPLLNHLSVSYETKTDEYLYIVHVDDRYVLMHNKNVIDWCIDINGIVPMLHGNSLLIAYDLSQCLFGLHAGAVFCQEKCVLLPALSGSGKSTLIAALVGSGATFCSDDLVLLTPSPVRMRPVPFVIGLKSGSWDLLAPYNPNIASLPTHLRSDDKHIRYFVPPVDAMVPMTSQPFHIDYIVFPKFVDSCDSAALTEIKAADGLCKLTNAGYEINGEMTATSIKQLIDWITDIPCFEIHFNRLDKALSTIQTLIS